MIASYTMEGVRCLLLRPADGNDLFHYVTLHRTSNKNVNAV